MGWGKWPRVSSCHPSICSQSRSYSITAHLKLSSSYTNAHSSPVPAASNDTHDDNLSFQQDWIRSGVSSHKTSVRRKGASKIHQVTTKLSHSESVFLFGQPASSLAGPHETSLESKVKPGEDVRTGVSQGRELFEHASRSLSHASQSHGAEYRSASSSLRSQAESAIDIQDAVLDLSPENIDVIASEMASHRSSSDALMGLGKTPGNYAATAKDNRRASDRVLSRESQRPAMVKTTPREERQSRHSEAWQIQKAGLQRKLGEASWQPRKRLSPDALEGIRALHAQYPNKYTTPALATQFKVSPDAIRRILKSKWRPSDEEEEERRERWNKRGERIWGQMVELGVKPPKKWREMGVGRDRNSEASTRRTSTGRTGMIDRPRKQWSTWERAKNLELKAEIDPLAERIL